jgi:hypothetical protein
MLETRPGVPHDNWTALPWDHTTGQIGLPEFGDSSCGPRDRLLSMRREHHLASAPRHMSEESPMVRFDVHPELVQMVAEDWYQQIDFAPHDFR